MSKESGAIGTMDNSTEQNLTRHIGEALGRQVSRRGILKAVAAGAIMSALPACGPDNPPPSEKTATPEIPTSGIFAMKIPLSDVNPVLRSQFAEMTAREMTSVTGIQAIDPKDPKNMAGFFFVGTSDPKENYAMFKKPATEENPASVVISHITAAAMLNNKTGQVSFGYSGYLEDDGTAFPFLSLLLDKYIPRQSGETDDQYKDRAVEIMRASAQEIKSKANNPESIEEITITNPFAGERVTIDTKDRAIEEHPNLFQQFMDLLSPAVAYAQELEPTVVPSPIASIPILEPTRSMILTTTPENAPTVAPTVQPTTVAESTSTPEAISPPETEKILDLAPAVLSPELRKRYLAEGEYLTDTDLEGRVFVDKKTGAYVLLAPSVYESMKTSLTTEGMSALDGSEWTQIVEKYTNRENVTNGTIPTDSLISYIRKEDVFIYSKDGVWLLPSIYLTDSPGGFVPKLYTQDAVHSENKKIIEDYFFYNGWINPLPLRWSETHEVPGFNDGFQIKYRFNLDTKAWEEIPPHERRDGRAEFLSPEQRVRGELGVMKEITGYDGTGLWEEATDENGIAYIKVHATQDASSAVAYEVILDERGNPQMFTIRECDYHDEAGGKIVGLDEAQASLTRQAWRILETADPNVDETNPGFLEKSWRINRVSAVGIKTLPENQGSTNWLVNNKVGLILFNSKRFNDGVGAVVTNIEGEKQELYASQYGWGEGWVYIRIPPDAMDENAVADTTKRSLEWLEKYGMNLPIEVYNEMFNFETWHLTQITNIPIEPQIPFNP